MQGGKNKGRTRLQELPLGFVGDSVLFIDLLHTLFFKVEIWSERHLDCLQAALSLQGLLGRLPLSEPQRRSLKIN